MSGQVMGMLQPDGSWRISFDADWPRSRRWDTPWTIRNGSWGQRPDPAAPVTRQNDPRIAFKINTTGA